MKKKPQEQQEEQRQGDFSTGELPLLSIVIISQVQDFQTQRVELISKNYTLADCKAGLRFLIKQYEGKLKE